MVDAFTDRLVPKYAGAEGVSKETKRGLRLQAKITPSIGVAYMPR